jgi:hypothetical protein
LAGFATLMALMGTAVDPVSGGAVSPAQTRLLSGEGSEQAGPSSGAIDPRFSTSAAARATIAHGHQHHSSADATSTTSSTGTAASAAAAALDPAVYGSWQRTSYQLPMRAIHATLLRTGKVLLLAGSGNQSSQFAAGTFQAGLLDPTTGTYQAVNPPYDMFCAGHAQLPNGNVLIVGGTAGYATSTANWKGSNRVYEFDVVTERWIARPSMAHGRWYPSSVQGPTGDVWSFAGQDETGRANKGVDVYASSTGQVLQKPAWSLPHYPGLLWTSKNRVFYAGTRSDGAAGQPGLYNPSNGAVQPVNGITLLNQRRGAATLFSGDASRQRALVLGGGWPATDTTSYVDLLPATPVGVPGPRLATAKGYVGAVNLPTDGSVFQTGGGTGRDTPVFESSIIRDGTVIPMAPNTVGRTYHSSTLLLPDGRVLTMGGDDAGSAFEMQVEVFSPPYLYRGRRPVIVIAPSRMGYTAPYSLTVRGSDASLTSAWLVRPSSTTHAVDPNQRAIRLSATRTTTGLRITTPTASLAPPGYYMLFVNDAKGRPSPARWIRIG